MEKTIPKQFIKKSNLC